MSWKFNWGVRTDSQGRPAGTYAISPCPITENETWYFLINDENPTGKAFQLGTKYYVDGGYGGGGSDGSWAHPWTTIAAARAAVGNGNNTIIVRGAHDAFDGVYHESGIPIRLGVDDAHRYMIVGYGQERPVIDAGGADENIFSSSGVTSFPSSAFFTLQRVKLQNTQAHGIQLGTLNSGGERKRDMYVNIIDVEGYMCGCEITNGSSGAFYAMNADHQWRFHCKSGHAYAHAYKIGDGSRFSLTEWCEAYEFGYWAGLTQGSAGHPSGFDYPDCGYDHELRYSICRTGLFYGIQVRGNSSTTYEPQGVGSINIHHNEIFDTTHFDDVTGELGHVSPSQVLLYTTFSGKTPLNVIRFHSNIVRDSADAGSYGVYVAGSCDCEDVYIYNNLIYGNAGQQVYVSDTDGRVHVQNNSIYGASAPLVYSANGADTVFTNNLMYQTGAGACVDAASATHTYNRCYAPSGSVGWTNDATDETANPGWVEVPSGAYTANKARLVAAVLGTDLSAYFTVDANGNERGASPDKGWLEITTGGEGVVYEDFENLLKQSWTVVGTPTGSFVAPGLHGSSGYHFQIKGPAGSYYWNEPVGIGNHLLWGGWFDIEDHMTSGSTILAFDVRTPSTGLLVFTFTVAKTGSQLTVTPGYYNGKSGAAINITAGVPNHFVIDYNNADDTWKLYWNTVPDIGAYVQSGTADSIARTPGRLRMGIISATGTYGSGTTILKFDSFDVDAANLVHDAEDAITYGVIYDGNGETGGTEPVDAGAYETGDTVTVLGNTGSLIRTGYTFAGWNTESDGTGTAYDGADTFVMGSAGVVLYAQWVEESSGDTRRSWRKNKRRAIWLRR